jgi:hypothetical protein
MAAMIPIVEANAQTIQKVRYLYSSGTYDCHASHPHCLTATPGEYLDYPDIFAGNRSLCSIAVIEPPHDMVRSLSAFGDLNHLTLLKIISLKFDDRFRMKHFGAFEWSKLDAILALAGSSLEAVNIYADGGEHCDRAAELASAKGWLPSVAEKISLHLPVEMGEWV